MAKHLIVKIEGTDDFKEQIQKLIDGLHKMKQDVIRLENSPLRMRIEEGIENEIASTDN